LREEVVALFERADVEAQEEWMLHALRQILSMLLANPACNEGADSLTAALSAVNRAQRGKRSSQLLPKGQPLPAN
jgi:hypothetical protein